MIISVDANFGWSSTRIYCVSIATSVDTTKHPNIEYCITGGFVAGEEPSTVANGSTNKKHIMAIISDAINVVTIDVVKYLLLPSMSNFDFLFMAIICPPSPNNHSNTVINKSNGSKSSSAATAFGPMNAHTKRLSTTELMFNAITMSRLGINISLNLLSAIL